MRANRRDILKGLGAAAAGLALPAILTRRAGAADEIPVGSLLDASGPINIYGLPMIDSTRFAVEDINAAGGVLGRPLKLVEFDTQSNNQLYTQYASQLILESEAAVIMGGITSASREAVRPVVDKNEQLYFYNEQYEGGVCDKFVFCTGVTPAQQLGTLVPWAVQEHGKTFYTLAADYNYGHISADWVKVFLKQAGGSLAGEEFIPLDVVDFSSVIQRVERAKPDVVMSLLVGGNHIAFYRQFAAAGLNRKIPTVSATFGLGNEQVVLQPEEAAGLVVVYPYFQELDTPANKAWVERWHKRFGADYTYITDSACTVWNGWHLWAMAANKAGSLDRAKVTEALESGLTFDSPEGTIKLDPQSHHVVHTVHLAKVNDKHGFDILKSFPDLEPTDTKQVCDLIKDPDQHTQ
ncbi:MAG: transporter substrate-binding protein, partial [Rhodospirillaceae bacterium]|nr:transporter substrate-binding protein [Rhodospirillaceae bacterium]